MDTSVNEEGDPTGPKSLSEFSPSEIRNEGSSVAARPKSPPRRRRSFSHRKPNQGPATPRRRVMWATRPSPLTSGRPSPSRHRYSHAFTCAEPAFSPTDSLIPRNRLSYVSEGEPCSILRVITPDTRAGLHLSPSHPYDRPL